MEKIWLKSYPKGVPAEINPDTYPSIPAMFEESCKRFRDLPAFYNLGTTFNFEEMEKYSKAFAAYFQQVLNLKKGDRIAIMMPNILQYPIVLFGALFAGLTVVNVNPLYTAPELVHQIRDAGAETIVVISMFAETVQKALPDTPLKNIIVTELGDLFPPLKATLINFVMKYIKRKIPHWEIPQAILFKDAFSHGKKLTFNPVKITSQDIAFLQYTGGTTGVAKGAMLTHRNIIANVIQAENWFGSSIKSAKEISITALPLYHIFSLTANCMFFSKMGGLNVLITNPRDIPSMISDLSKFKFTVITAVNTLFNGLLKNPKFKTLDFSALHVSLGGGMAIQHTVAEKWKETTGIPILEAYGLTETSPAVIINPPDLQEFNGSVGLPLPSTDVCILDEEGKELSIGETGELAVKGPQVMYGYWRNPAETQKAFTKNGWLLTGDMATIDEKGFVYIRERKKDMILVSGFNVYPNEIEDVLVKLEGIREAAVIGVLNEKSREMVKAFIVKENPELTEDDILNYCRKNLTPYKIPKIIEFCDDLPKTNVGKILRRALREDKQENKADH